MNALILLSILLSAALGIARGADLAFGTDAVTGLCTVGSVWWRYAALGAVVLAAVLIGRHCAGKAETVRSRQPLAGVLAFAGAVCFLAAAGAQLAVGLSATSSFVRSILECICAVWLSTLGRCWLTPSVWKKPTGGLYLAVAGSVLFYWNVLMRFMENSSSWHRVAPTAMVWQLLAGLVFTCFRFRFRGSLYLKLALVCLLSLTVCTVAINTTGFYLYYQKIGFTEKAIEAISEKFGTGVTYWTYVGYRLLIGGQGWNCLANYALLFALIPLLNRIRPLNLNIG